MRAVNLIPADERSGAGGAAGRSGGAVYVVLGGLAAFVVLVAVWAMTGSRIADDRAELGRLQAEANAAQAQLSQLAAVDGIRSLRDSRATLVRTLAATRTDWGATLDAIARTLPADTWLSSMTAAKAPGAGPAGGTGGSGAVASSSLAPSIQVGGCSPSQARVARLMPRLRTVPGVERVSLVSSQAAEAGQSTAAGAAECRRVSFEMVLFFAAPAAAPGTPPAPGAPATTALPVGGGAVAPTEAGK